MQIRTAKRTIKSQVIPKEEKRVNHNLFRRLLPLLIFLCLAGCLSTIIYWYYFMPRAIGRLQIQRYAISSKRSALIKKILIKPGDKVTTNQVLVELDTNELLARKKSLEKALFVASEKMPSTYGELRLKQDELRLKLDDNLIFRAIDVESARSSLKEDSARYESTIEQLKGAEIELNRRQKLVKTGAVSQSKLDEIQTRYNALTKQVENYKKVVESDETRFQTAVKRYKDYNERNINVPIEEIIRPVKASVNQAKEEINVIQAAIDNSILKAPYDGYVMAILRNENEGVQAGDSIVQIINGSTTVIESYIKEKWYNDAKLGKPVKLKPRISNDSLRGEIFYIAPFSSKIPMEFLENYEQDKVSGIRILIKLEKEFNGPLGTHFDILF